MLSHDLQGRVVHYPDDPDHFAFDADVAAVFPSMSTRSIPNFLAAHAAHARMLKAWMVPGARILDVGSARGAFLKELRQRYLTEWEMMNVEAIDSSVDMCHYLQVDFPDVVVRCEDIATHDFLRARPPLYDVICVSYVLQFIPPQWQNQVVIRLFNLVRPGGAFILGHKSRCPGRSGEMANEEYIRFRVDNGYTREEIDAKTQALKGSMFPMDHHMLMAMMRSQFSEVTETFRYMMFSTVFAVK